ncbi:hypothetical protein AVEN_243945-1 [Araneus ventricosus]|uniref:Uncharacterized protein n=1 Tax=Araneus ventricosus TaxID=182803 RepID=A0A4Y2QMK1_ARAVE|nr:hypothetical protein AVEN_243945-1 [Araneus ventricosus]
MLFSSDALGALRGMNTGNASMIGGTGGLIGGNGGLISENGGMRGGNGGVIDGNGGKHMFIPCLIYLYFNIKDCKDDVY